MRAPPAGTWERRRANLYAPAEEWLGGPGELGVEAATELLVRRYLSGFGPASRQDVARFCGLPAAAVNPALERIGPRTFRYEGGGELVDVPRAPLPAADTPAPPRLLPTFDSTLLTHARRTGLLPEEYRPRIFNTRNPQSSPTFLVDGRVAGTWRHEAGKVRLEPFERLDAGSRRALEAEAEAIGELFA